MGWLLFLSCFSSFMIFQIACAVDKIMEVLRE